jgi:hypothetical protein
MPLSLQTVFLTDLWKAKEGIVRAALQPFGASIWPNEAITIDVGERQTDSHIHVTITREHLPVAKGDNMSAQRVQKTGAHVYERAFQRGVSVMELGESIGLMLAACKPSG